jgi:molybdopterin-guanine dinucleotide biosynthesis protein A
MIDVEGFILVGGRSSRMGRDKALLSFGGQQFRERIRDALHSVTRRVSLVGAKPEEAAVQGAAGWPNVPDVYEQWGALGGLHAALEACRAEWAAVVACDLPFVTGQLFARLAQLAEDYEAVVPVQPDGRRQPLCALYRVRSCRELARELIAEGERRPREMLHRLRARLVAPEELMDLNGAQDFFRNINTQEEYLSALERLAARP